MKALIKLGAISMLASGLFVTACGDDDDSGTATGGKGGSGGSVGKGGSGGGVTSGGTGAKGGSGGTASGGLAGTTGAGAGGMDAGNGGTAGAEQGGTGGVEQGGTAGVEQGGAAGAEQGGGGAGGAGGAEFPTAPSIGKQIDRMGRPGVNTALTDPFDIVTTSTKDQVKDAYNAASNPATWSTLFRGYIRQNLGILDGLDSSSSATGCGNQFAIGPATTGTGVSRYDGLAGVLVDDRLYVNTHVTGATLSCAQYLAVEANATAIVPNTDCGGRKPTYDVIDTTYSTLAIGALSGVTDGVVADGKVTTTFPFLAAPQ